VARRPSLTWTQSSLRTEDEMLRIKAFLAVRRNATRGYLDVAALAAHVGIDHAAAVLGALDEYYAVQAGPDGERVATQVARQLADPRPHDLTGTDLARYRKLHQRWQDWAEVARVCREVASRMVIGGNDDPNEEDA
jgi:hypothetical protein